MSGMILHLDELDEEGRPERRHLELSVDDAKSLLEGTGYHITDGIVAAFQADRVDSTIRIVGSFDSTVEYRCGRCLETRRKDVEIDSEFVLMEQSRWRETYEAEEEMELEPEDMDISFYEGDEIDLGPLVREAMLLELPTLPRCPPELRGECDEAFERNIGDETIEELAEAAMDQRWAPLRDIELKD